MTDKTAIEKAREALALAQEALHERRYYCEQWEYKYGKEWDDEDEIVQAAIESLAALDTEKPGDTKTTTLQSVIALIRTHYIEKEEDDMTESDKGYDGAVADIEYSVYKMMEIEKEKNANDHSART